MIGFPWPGNFVRWLMAEIRLGIKERLEVLMPAPPYERASRVVLFGSAFRQIDNLMELEEMTQRIEGVNIRGDKVAYVSEGPVSVLNEKSAPMDPQPELSTIAVTGINVMAAYLSSDRRLVVQPDDAQPAGTPWSVSVSADATGEEDDLVVAGIYDPDGVGLVDGSALGNFVETAEPPLPG